MIEQILIQLEETQKFQFKYYGIEKNFQKYAELILSLLMDLI